MRLLIVSDLHGSTESAAMTTHLARSLQPDACVLLGDVLYHGPRNPLPQTYNPHEAARLLSEMPAPMLALRGNCDAEVDTALLPFPLVENAWLFIDDLRILALHGHTLSLDAALRQGVAPGTAILSGHTHIPAAHSAEGLHWWNPGSISLPKENHPRSYGLYEDGQFTVLDAEGRPFLRHRPDKFGAGNTTP